MMRVQTQAIQQPSQQQKVSAQLANQMGLNQGTTEEDEIEEGALIEHIEGLLREMDMI